MLLLTILFSLVVVGPIRTDLPLAQAKHNKIATPITKSSSLSSDLSLAILPGIIPPPSPSQSTTRLSSSSLSPSDTPYDFPAPSKSEQHAIVQKLFTASAIATANSFTARNASRNFAIYMNGHNGEQLQKQQQQQQRSCLNSSYIDKFISPLKESRFTHIRPCVTVTGTIINRLRINADGDITFNIALDPPYAGMLGPGNLDPSRETSSGKYGVHIEVICQEPVVSRAPMDVGACNGYNGLDFHPLLPAYHDHVMITGRFQIEWKEAPGGLTEIHPVYAIKTIPES
jgi:hypothetical protein